MQSQEFMKAFADYFGSLRSALATDKGDWVVKGFIDVYRNIYTISADTKVLSKLMELLLYPAIGRFAQEGHFKMVLSEHQNHYPDITFISEDGAMFALDLKSTYRKGKNRVNGFTLGAFTGYFRNRDSAKNVTFPYGQYAAHFVLGIIYSRCDAKIDERAVYNLEDLLTITSVVRDFRFLFQEKWRIAGTRPGSGNTKNIGSITDEDALIAGKGPFAPHGIEIFDAYWMNYLTRDMARAIDSPVPFRNLAEYWSWHARAGSPQS